MASEIDQRLQIAYVVDEEELRRLDAILGGSGSTVRYLIVFRNGVSVERCGIGPLLLETNDKSNPIVKLTARASWGRAREVTVELHSRSTNADGQSPATVCCRASGTEQAMAFLNSQLSEWASGIRRWYTPLVTSPATPLFQALLLPVFPIAALVAVARDPWEISVFSLGLGDSRMIAFWALFSIPIVVRLSWSRIFPVSTFAIGRGLQRHNDVVRLRRYVAATIASLMIASLWSQIPALFTGR
jgi:hypothetical protein